MCIFHLSIRYGIGESNLFKTTFFLLKVCIRALKCLLQLGNNGVRFRCQNEHDRCGFYDAPQRRKLGNLKSLEKWVRHSIHLMIRYFLGQICVAIQWPFFFLSFFGWFVVWVQKGLSLVTFRSRFGESSGKAAWLVGSFLLLSFPALWLQLICVQVQNPCPRTPPSVWGSDVAISLHIKRMFPGSWDLDWKRSAEVEAV